MLINFTAFLLSYLDYLTMSGALKRVRTIRSLNRFYFTTLNNIRLLVYFLYDRRLAWPAWPWLPTLIITWAFCTTKYCVPFNRCLQRPHTVNIPNKSSPRGQLYSNRFVFLRVYYMYICLNTLIHIFPYIKTIYETLRK